MVNIQNYIHPDEVKLFKGMNRDKFYSRNKAKKIEKEGEKQTYEQKPKKMVFHWSSLFFVLLLLLFFFFGLFFIVTITVSRINQWNFNIKAANVNDTPSPRWDDDEIDDLALQYVANLIWLYDILSKYTVI